MAVSIALDRHDPQRELTSQLLSDLTGALLTKEEVAKGFDDLLDNLNDLTLDTPDAPTVSIFICSSYLILNFSCTLIIVYVTLHALR